jgi:hypothetical protein
LNYGVIYSSWSGGAIFNIKTVDRKSSLAAIFILLPLLQSAINLQALTKDYTEMPEDF